MLHHIKVIVYSYLGAVSELLGSVNVLYRFSCYYLAGEPHDSPKTIAVHCQISDTSGTVSFCQLYFSSNKLSLYLMLSDILLVIHVMGK